MKSFLNKIFPSKKEKDLKALWPFVDEVSEAYAQLHTLTDDELRGKTAEFKGKIADYTEEIRTRVDELKAEAESTTDAHAKESLFKEIDELEKEHYTQIDEVLTEIAPEAFAVVKETAR
ncbi:MAG: preprotein translocase subunit SecA, partial [Bacteroidota bacterium]